MNSLFLCRVSVSLLLCFVYPQISALALQINIELEDHGHNPSFDPDGSKLQAIFLAAADHWESLIGNGTTHTVDVWWEPVTNSMGGPAHAKWMQTSNPFGDNDIRVNPNYGWFIDSTPNDHSEFDFDFSGSPQPPYYGQTLYRDVTATQQGDWFSGGTPPSLLEIGYRGSATAGTPASNQFDLLSTVLHELGHELGVHEGIFSNDPFRLLYVPGDVEVVHDTGGHLAPRSSLMCSGCANLGLRRLPSTVDVLAVAYKESLRKTAVVVPGLLTVDLPRKHFFSGDNWNIAAGWIGNRVPDSLDEVWLLEGQTVSLTAWGYAGGLVIDEQSVLYTSNQKIAVAGAASISGGALVNVLSGGEFEAASATIGANSILSIASGGLVDVTVFRVDPNGMLEGSGGSKTIHIGTLLTNNGAIRSLNGGTLTFTSASSTPWDLDGDGEAGVVDALMGNITLASGQMTDLFSGTMQVGAGRTVNIVASWFVDKSGIVKLNGGLNLTDRARLAGGAFGQASPDSRLEVQGLAHIDVPYQNVLGTVSLTPGATLEFNGPATLGGGVFSVAQTGNLNFNSTVNFVGNVAMNTYSTSTSHGDIELNGTTTYGGGTLTLQGLLRQDGNASVTGATTANMTGVFDMDGSNATPSTWTINRPLTINADYVEIISSVPQVNPNNVVNSTISIAHAGSQSILQPDMGSLSVNLSNNRGWRMAGTLNLDGSTSAPSNIIPVMVAGSPVAITGTVNVKDRVAIDAANTLAGNVVFDSGASLYLSGRSTIAPTANFVGAGQLVSTSDRFVVQSGAYVGVPLTTHGEIEIGFVDTVSSFGGTALTVGPAGSLTFDLAGNMLPNHYDRAVISGHLHLGGTLRVELLSDYVPDVGESFDLMDWGSMSGTFAHFELPKIVGRGWDSSQLYTAGLLSVTAGLDGDFDFDGDVDGHDFLIWQRGETNPPLSPTDLAVWQAHYGSPGPLSSTQAVPEPSTILLLGGMTAVCFASRRKQRVAYGAA